MPIAVSVLVQGETVLKKHETQGTPISQGIGFVLRKLGCGEARLAWPECQVTVRIGPTSAGSDKSTQPNLKFTSQPEWS